MVTPIQIQFIVDRGKGPIDLITLDNVLPIHMEIGKEIEIDHRDYTIMAVNPIVGIDRGMWSVTYQIHLVENK